MSNIALIPANTVGDIMNCRAALLCFDENGQPEQSFIQKQDADNQIWRKVEDLEELKHRIENLRTACDIGAKFYDWPIYGRDYILGILRIPTEAASVMSETKLQLLHSMIESTSLAMDRFRSTQERMKSKEETVQERYRGNLLRAISHDLRTPLSGIMGAAEMFMDMTATDNRQYTLAEGIHKDADWLHSLVENILNLTRLQDGKLVLNKQMETAEEVIGSALNHIMQRLPEHEITVNIPDEPLFIPMDAELIAQMLVNLLDNAIKHTPPQKEIVLTVTKDNVQAVFSTADRGSGIATADLPKIFQIFYTTQGKQTNAQRGIGLGLAICEAIVKAHGGTIEAHNRSDGEGAEFIFTLPMEVQTDAEQK